MAKKAPTRAEKLHMSRVASLGCIICEAPTELHHPTRAGWGRRSSHMDVIPLCPYHHRLGPFGEAVHNGTKTFESRYGTQQELLSLTREKLEEQYEY